MTTSQAETAIPTSSKVLCAVYGVIAIAALIATWSQNAAYFDNPGRFMIDFFNDSKVTPASRSLTVDIVLFFLAAAILMVAEARKHGVKFVWAYIVGGLAIAISVTFPLFLIARERRLDAREHAALAPGLSRGDRIGLVGLGGALAAFSLWTVGR